MGEVRITRLQPVHDPDAYDRVIRILGHGLRRGVYRLYQLEADLNSARTNERHRADT